RARRAADRRVLPVFRRPARARATGNDGTDESGSIVDVSIAPWLVATAVAETTAAGRSFVAAIAATPLSPESAGDGAGASAAAGAGTGACAAPPLARREARSTTSPHARGRAPSARHSFSALATARRP